MQRPEESTSDVPPFLVKLWKMVNDPSTDHLISWNSSGTSMIILDQSQFWSDLLPLYYKHNNMSSFVRQLNMYGFHKNSIEKLNNDKQEVQFSHPLFLKDHPELLSCIKRKTKKSASHEDVTKSEELSKVATEVKYLGGCQANIDNQLEELKRENGFLWKEVATLREKYLKQKKVVDRLIEFLIGLVQTSRWKVGEKRGCPLMIDERWGKKKKFNNVGKLESFNSIFEDKGELRKSIGCNTDLSGHFDLSQEEFRDILTECSLVGDDENLFLELLNEEKSENFDSSSSGVMDLDSTQFSS